MIQGNRIGTNRTGTLGLGNALDGVWVDSGTTSTTIGGQFGSTGNVISGNQRNGVLDFAQSGPRASNTSVKGNLIGLSAAGDAAIPNREAATESSGINFTVGGYSSPERNYVVGAVSAVSATGVLVAGNYIGTDITGSIALHRSGIRMIGTTNATIGGGQPGARNVVVANNFFNAISISGNGSGNKVQGNYVGIDANGTNILGNGSSRSIFVEAQSGVVIGTDGDNINDDAEGNIVANTFEGITLALSEGSTIAGNKIGVDASGTRMLGNTTIGIRPLGSAVRIGTDANGVSDPQERNVIGATIGIYSEGYSNSLPFQQLAIIAGNSIGTDATGTIDLGNTDYGIFDASSSVAVVGGTNPAQGNLIAFNRIGILINSDSNFAIRKNSIYSNDQLGIQDTASILSNVTINSAVAGSTTRVTGTVTGVPSTTYDVDFFANEVADPSGFGEGQRYLGSISVATDSSGTVVFTNSAISAFSVAGEFISAIATPSVGKSSQFSNALVATTVDPPTIDSSSLIMTLITDDSDLFGLPSTLYNEGQTVRLDGLFIDNAPSASHTVTINWGDGSAPSVLNIPAGPRGFTAEHIYEDDRPSGTPLDRYTISIFVSNDVTGATGFGSTIVDIANVSPVLVSPLSLSNSQAQEGDVITVSGTFVDPGSDVHTLRINWGDGSPIQLVQLPVGARSFNIPHAYADDASLITVELSDDDSLGIFSTATTSIVVTNRAPVPVIIGSSDALEGAPLTLFSTSVDPGSRDVLTHSWVVRRGNEAVQQSTGPTLVFTAPDEGIYTVELTSTDDEGASATTSRTINVANQAPFIASSSLILRDLNGAPLNSIPESTPFQLSGTFFDPGLKDSHRVEIDWGDGSLPTVLQLPRGVTAFSSQYEYPDDNPVGTSVDATQIRVTVLDNAEASSTTVRVVNVENTPPQVTIVDAGSTDTVVKLRAIARDRSANDLTNVQFLWNVTAAIPTSQLNQATIEFPRTLAAGFAFVNVRVTDDDNGVGEDNVAIVLGTDQSDAISVNPSNTQGNVTVSVTTGITTNTAEIDADNVVLILSQASADTITVSPLVTSPTRIYAGDGDDTVTGGSGPDTVVGGLGDDSIASGAGDDSIIIAEGDDTVDSGLGNDKIDIEHFSEKTLTDPGGIDTLDFNKIPQLGTTDVGIILNLSISNGARQNVQPGGVVSLNGVFENLIGTKYNDKVYGNTTSNLLFGGDGSDSIYAGSGNDSVYTVGEDIISGGNDSINGGLGNDLIFGGSFGNDSIYGGEGDDSIYGGSGNDAFPASGPIVGNVGVDSIDAGEGNDLIFGGTIGEDSILGGDGNDTIYAGSGAPDTFTGSFGNDSIFGGDGNDLIFGGDNSNDSIDGGEGNDSIFAGDGTGPTYGDDTFIGGSGNDYIFGGTYQDDSIDGGDGNDTIYSGSELIDSITASLGNDSIFGGAGNDLIFGGTYEDDSIVGGDGNDTIYGGVSPSETITAGLGNDSIFGGDGNDLIFGGFNNDSIDGGSGNDTIYAGGAGNDTVYAGDSNPVAGDQTITGGGGNDLIFGGTSDSDSIDGGLGNDTIIAGDGNSTVFGGGGDDSIQAAAGNDIILGGFGDDTLVGGGGSTTIQGGDGNDLIFGGSFGDDSLDGGIGNDSIYAGAGDQSINGGAGDDTVVGSDGQETVSGGSGNDVILAGDGDSSIFGGAGNDLIFGGSGGNDSIYGGEGDDSIYGGDNNDSIYGGPGVVVAGDEVSNDIIDGGTGNDLIFGGSIGNDSIYGGEGNDSIIGATANDAIYGGDGDDTLVGGIGDSTLLGGDGNDLIFGGSMGGDSIDGGTGNDSILLAGNDETVLGGSGNDTIYSNNTGNNIIDAGSGDDQIHGGTGLGSLIAGSGNDTIWSGSGDESISAGEGNDLIFGGSFGDDSIDAGDGDDSIQLAGGNDSIFAGSGNDTIITSDGTETISAGDGNDLIFGGSLGNDSIYGGEGNDTIIANSDIGQDSIDGGAGNDLIFGQVTGNATVTASILQFNANAVFHLQHIEDIKLIGDSGNNVLDASAASARVYLDGAGGNDSLIGGLGDDVLVGGSGVDYLAGGAGNDTYLFFNSQASSQTVFESANAGSDTLDFSSVMSSINLDLSSTSAQAAASNLSVQLIGDLENIIGSDFNDRLVGNDLNNILIGQGGQDTLLGGAGNDRLEAGRRRTVFLDFDSASEIGEHVYSSLERNAILTRIQADYAAFDVQFVTTRPTSGQYVTILFNAAVYLPGSQLALGGISERIGWRELSGGGIVQVDVNGFFGTQRNRLPGTVENFVALSSTIAAHELAHTYGLRHQDAFGPPGSGVFDGGKNAFRYRPVFTGPKAAFETKQHLIASPASVGTTLVDALGNPYFGERESLKLAFSETGSVVTEIPDSLKSTQLIGTQTVLVQPLGALAPLSVPNTLQAGASNFGRNLDAAASGVIGEIKYTSAGRSENDYYSFQGRKDDVVTIEVMSQSLRHRFNNTIDSLLRVYNSAGQKIAYYGSLLGAFNDDSIEPTDSILIDLVLPADDSYTIEVDTFSFQAPEFSIYQPSFNVAGYSAAFPNDPAVTDRDRGQYELLVYRFNGTTPAQTGDNLNGGAGADLLYGNSGKEVLLGFNSAEDLLFDSSGASSYQNTVPIITAIPDQTGAEGQTIQFTAVAIDPDGDFGNGWSIEPVDGYSLPAGATIDSSTGLFSASPNDNGLFAVRIVATDTTALTTSQVVYFTISNQAPTATVTHNGPVNEGSPITISLTNVNDPSSVDSQTLRYSIASSIAGLAANYGDAGIASSAVFTPTDNGTSNYYVRVFDKDGGFNEYSTTVVATNVAPTATITSNGPVDEGSEVTISLTNVNDPSSEDGLSLKYSFADSAAGLAATYATAGTSLSAVFATNDSGTKIYYARVFDKDGGFTDYSTSVFINNVAPTASITNNGPVNEGSPVTISLAGFNDPSSEDGLSLKYSFADSAAGLAATYATAGTSSSAVFATNDSGTKIYYARVFDKDGGFTDYSTSVVINNIAPTASITNNGPVNEGSPVTISLTGFNDPSSEDGLSLKYSFADSTAGLAATYATAGTSSSAVFATSDSGTKIYYARVFDKDGGFTDYSTLVVINNVAPTALSPTMDQSTKVRQ